MEIVVMGQGLAVFFPPLMPAPAPAASVNLSRPADEGPVRSANDLIVRGFSLSRATDATPAALWRPARIGPGPGRTGRRRASGARRAGAAPAAARRGARGAPRAAASARAAALRPFRRRRR